MFKADARTISLTAVMTAIVFVFTRFIQIPIGTGYFNLSDVAIYFTAFACGPWLALIAGGPCAAPTRRLTATPRTHERRALGGASVVSLPGSAQPAARAGYSEGY